MKLTLSQEQIRELKRVSRNSKKAYVRIKALALLSCAAGRSQSEVAGIFQVTRKTVREWCRRFVETGVCGLEVRAGRGRPPQADPEQIARYVLQSPRNFGVDRTRWTLELLAQTVPCLNGFTRYGVQQALRKAGFRYKRGQPSMHSPDPDYDKKKGHWTRR